MIELSIIKNIKDFAGVTKALQDIEKTVNELVASTNVPSEGEVSDTDGKTGDIRITQNEDKDYIFEVRAEDGWKTPVTKRRMNQTSELYDLDYEVFQVDYEWYVKDSRKCIHNFYGESVTIKR